MNNWTPRQKSGAILAGFGACAVIINSPVMNAIAGAPEFVVGLVQVVLGVVGLGGMAVGLYRMVTKDKK